MVQQLGRAFVFQITIVCSKNKEKNLVQSCVAIVYFMSTYRMTQKQNTKAEAMITDF